MFCVKKQQQCVVRGGWCVGHVPVLSVSGLERRDVIWKVKYQNIY